MGPDPIPGLTSIAGSRDAVFHCFSGSQDVQMSETVFEDEIGKDLGNIRENFSIFSLNRIAWLFSDGVVAS